MEDRLAKVEEAIADLRDGKWNAKDLKAIFTILGSIAGWGSAAVLALQGAGLLQCAAQ